MRIGIYAGTFDPVHNGHIQFAQSALNEAKLEKVVIVAEKNPYRKKPNTSWDHRQAMIERATQDIDAVDHDYEFSNTLSHSYTMQNMLTAAKKHYGEEHEFWFLVGSDIFEHMKRWQDIAKKNEYGGFVVALRDDHTIEWLRERVQELKEHNFHFNFTIVVNSHPHISSKKIRDLLQSHHSPEGLPQVVIDYIQTHKLYTA